MNCKHKVCPLLGISLIPLTRGEYAIVDTEDYAYLMQWKWCAQPSKTTWYAMRWAPHPSGEKGKGATIFMHRVITGATGKWQTDHVNHNGLDNRRCNLRRCSRSENNQNRLPLANCSSPYKGVTWSKDKGEWQAQITLNSKTRYLGHFPVETDAAYAYDEKAKELFGDFAYLNFPGLRVRDENGKKL